MSAMSKTTGTDDIDDLMSSVRDFVSHKEWRKAPRQQKLILTQDQRVAESFAAEPAQVSDNEDLSLMFSHHGSDNIHLFDPARREETGHVDTLLPALETATSAQPDVWEDLPEDEFEDGTTDSAESEAGTLAGLDAEALRALIVEIVHEELSGKIGERMTRNVRKLVRREINRVLLSRELTQGE